MLKRSLLFLLINFAGLALGAQFTSDGVASPWYLSLQKAPWTPPGWVFGFAWTGIMICFAIYMALLWEKLEKRKRLLQWFGLQWILNFAWNPIFFYFHESSIGLFVILALSLLITYFLFRFWNSMRLASFWIAPYFIWLLIASSLNAYIVLYN